MHNSAVRNGKIYDKLTKKGFIYQAVILSIDKISNEFSILLHLNNHY